MSIKIREHQKLAELTEKEILKLIGDSDNLSILFHTKDYVTVNEIVSLTGKNYQKVRRKFKRLVELELLGEEKFRGSNISKLYTSHVHVIKTTAHYLEGRPTLNIYIMTTYGEHCSEINMGELN